MKPIKFTMVAVLLLAATACKKGANSENTITADEAADMVAGSISLNTSGFVLVADNVSSNALTLTSATVGTPAINATAVASKQACGSTVTDSVTNSGGNGSITFTSFYKYARTLTCNANSQPDNLVNNISFKGSFDGPRLSSTDAGNASVKIAGLTANASNFVINGNYNRTGAFTSKVGAKASGNSVIIITASNVLLSKPARNIISGTATIALSGSTKNGAFNYAGNVVFTGNNMATLSIGGAVYTVNLLTGVYTKQ